MRNFLVTVFLTVSFHSFCQLVNLPGALNAPLRDVMEGKQITGDRYLFSAYKSGVIYESSGQKHQVFLKYDMFKDEVEVFNNDEALILTKAFYPAFEFDFFDEESNSRKIIKYKSGFKIDGYTKENYFQVLLENQNYSFIKLNRVTLEEFVTSDYGGKNEVKSKFVNRERYFLYQPDGSYIELKNKKSTLPENFDGYEEKMKAFIKANKLKFKTEADLVELVTYYLQLNS